MFIAPVKGNQATLEELVHEVEASSEISFHYFNSINQSGDLIERDIFVYNSFPFSWEGVFINTVIRIDKSVNNGKCSTQYYISNDTGDGKYFLKRILQEWSVETMHFYKDRALYEDKCKVHKGAFALSVLRSIVINILHLNKIKNIAGKIVEATYDLTEALQLVSMVKLQCGLVKW